MSKHRKLFWSCDDMEQEIDENTFNIIAYIVYQESVTMSKKFYYSLHAKLYYLFDHDLPSNMQDVDDENLETYRNLSDFIALKDFLQTTIIPFLDQEGDILEHYGGYDYLKENMNIQEDIRFSLFISYQEHQVVTDFYNYKISLEDIIDLIEYSISNNKPIKVTYN